MSSESPSSTCTHVKKKLFSGPLEETALGALTRVDVKMFLEWKAAAVKGRGNWKGQAT